jgi:ATP phosphoribosyltransferase regulatory subunit HisZ
MILEHEIPNGSKLYFGKSAKIKRLIEQTASKILDDNGYEEIVTPVFSYHQHKSIADERELIKVNDEKNHSLSLRADSTIDVVRIIEKRLGGNITQKNGFIFNLFLHTLQLSSIKLVLNLWGREILQQLCRSV